MGALLRVQVPLCVDHDERSEAQLHEGDRLWGVREHGIPTVTDRLIQQALLKVLQPLIDPTFSPYSYGFRPGRSAQEAVVHAQSYVQSGRRIVVDVDLEKFFDRVNHDILMRRLQKRIQDAGVLRLIRAYLNSGIMDDGVLQSRHQGDYLAFVKGLRSVLVLKVWPVFCCPACSSGPMLVHFRPASLARRY
jgi:retron-type reverse transcriptase